VPALLRASADGSAAVNQKALSGARVIGAFLGGLVVAFGLIVLFAGPQLWSSGHAVAAVGGPFHLEDQNGHSFSDQNMKGRLNLVFFGYTHCPDICPTTLFDMSQLLQTLGPDADKIGVVFITVDPERDTPAVLKDYLSNFDPHLHGLTGDRPAIDAAIKAFRVYAKKVPLEGGDYSMDHTAMVYLMDKDGHFIAPFNLQRTADAEAADLRRYF
jgi:protein SCO1